MSGQFPDSSYFVKQITVSAKFFMKSISDAVGKLKVNAFTTGMHGQILLQRDLQSDWAPLLWVHVQERILM